MSTDTVTEKPWISLFEGNTMASKGMDLQFIPPMVKDRVKIGKLIEEEVANEAAMWKNVVILYVIRDSPTIAGVTRFLEGQAEYTRKPKVNYHNEVYFEVKFHSESDRNMVLGSRPHMINYKLVIVKPWTTSFNFKDEVLKVIPLWVRFPNLPLNCWGPKSLSRITRVLGKHTCSDECTMKLEHISYARALVEINITGPLPEVVRVMDPKDNMFEQKFSCD
ncbi:hypothetical protein R3W88_014822 [Solanum pinnatisectum]|uniref:DUF4283 domain-containing protein n=1 Tax=Solanum pinnatisectum TaxID=50273 RepID=A0AAV9KST2_9SOLN|nr:hypothetical protein R3W88_014822 [Solanum pinnatisectum]